MHLKVKVCRFEFDRGFDGAALYLAASVAGEGAALAGGVGTLNLH